MVYLEERKDSSFILLEFIILITFRHSCKYTFVIVLSVLYVNILPIVVQLQLINSKAYRTRRFNAAFTRALQ